MEGEKEENITFNHSYATQHKDNKNTINYFLKRINDGSIICDILKLFPFYTPYFSF
jgi:hypothetical protein